MGWSGLVLHAAVHDLIHGTSTNYLFLTLLMVAISAVVGWMGFSPTIE